jgi:hypothetical protein
MTLLNDLDSPEIKTFAQRRNVDLLRAEILPGELIRIVARATASSDARAGLLALTNRRLLFVREQVIRRGPFVVDIRLGDIADVKIEEEPLSGRLRIATAAETIIFDRIRPKVRTWDLYWGLGDERTASDVPSSS